MSGFVIARIHGIAVRLNWGVLLIAAAIAWTLAENVLPSAASSGREIAHWVWAILPTPLFFAGLIAHEFGHSLVAQHEGVKVSNITLWIFGGVASLESPVPSAASAFRIAIAGPAVSLGLGVGFIATGVLVEGVPRAALLWLGLMNIALAVFNLIPAFPLDGGRVYQSYLWHKTGSEVEATIAAARLGRILGGFLALLGLFEVLALGTSAGLWFIVLGWFIREAASAEVDYVRQARPLANVAVRQIMTADPVTVHGHATLTEFTELLLTGPRHATYPVVDDVGRLVGSVSVADLHRVDQQLWDNTWVSSIAKENRTLIVVSPDSTVLELLQRFDRKGDHRAVAAVDGVPVGIIAPSDAMRFVSVLDATTPRTDTT